MPTWYSWSYLLTLKDQSICDLVFHSKSKPFPDLYPLHARNGQFQAPTPLISYIYHSLYCLETWYLCSSFSFQHNPGHSWLTQQIDTQQPQIFPPLPHQKELDIPSCKCSNTHFQISNHPAFCPWKEDTSLLPPWKTKRKRNGGYHCVLMLLLLLLLLVFCLLNHPLKEKIWFTLCLCHPLLGRLWYKSGAQSRDTPNVSLISLVVFCQLDGMPVGDQHPPYLHSCSSLSHVLSSLDVGILRSVYLFNELIKKPDFSTHFNMSKPFWFLVLLHRS